MDLTRPINTENRVGRMLEAMIASADKRARLILTVSVESEARRVYHETFEIRKWVGRDDVENLAVSIRGTADWRRGVPPINVLYVNLETGAVFDPVDRAGARPLIRYSAEAALRYAWTGVVPSPRNGRVLVRVEDVCPGCGTKLDSGTIASGVCRACAGGRRRAMPKLFVPA